MTSPYDESYEPTRQFWMSWGLPSKLATILTLRNITSVAELAELDDETIAQLPNVGKIYRAHIHRVTGRSYDNLIKAWSDNGADHAGFHWEDDGLSIDDDGYGAPWRGKRWLSRSDAIKLHKWLGRKIKP